MVKRHLLLFAVSLIVFSGGVRIAAQQAHPNRLVIRRTVVLVQLDVAVTDRQGRYVIGLRPSNFRVYEDGIPEQLATFSEESEAPRSVADFGRATSALATAKPGSGNPAPLSDLKAGHSVFILFDTSNYMYRGFVFAQDAISQFVQSLSSRDRVAFYSYSRDFSRDSLLTGDRPMVLRGVRTTVAGDDAALYDGLLLTLKDANGFSGRKVVVVFSNGPDNASVVAPEDVLELAQSEGIPIYMICTQQAKLDPISTAVFDRVSAATGGKAYFAKNWEDQQKAFASVRDDLAHLYSLSYYPQANSNQGWRKITVKLVGVQLKKYHLRTRTGYRPQAGQIISQVMSPQ